MAVYRRYFRVTTGPMVDEINDIQETNKKANLEYKKILTEIGAGPEYYARDRKLVGLIFEKDPDPKIYKRTRYGWFPKKNCKAGKDLAARIEAVEVRNPSDLLSFVGLPQTPTIFHESRCYTPTATVVPGEEPTVYISVPWLDEDPVKLDQYKTDREKGKRFSSQYDALLWEPSEDMQPVKKWEVDKHIDDYNKNLKQMENK